MFTGVWWKAGTIRRNIFRQLFEELVSVKISPSKFCAIRYLSNTPTSHGLYTTYNIYFGLGFCDVIFILICSYMTAEENFWKVTEKEKCLTIDHLYMTEEWSSENEDLIRQHKLTWRSQGAYGIILGAFIWMKLLTLINWWL